MNLISSGDFAGITTIWMGIVEIKVTDMVATIPRMLVCGRSSSIARIRGLEGF